MRAVTLVLATLLASNALGEATHRVVLTVTSDLPSGNVPMDPTIDFAKLVREAKLPGVLDPNSIEVISLATGEAMPFARTEDFAYGDRGRLEWAITDPAHKTFEIRFRTVSKRPPLEPQAYTPLVGVGDLARYNAGTGRPVVMPYLSRLIDLTGDGNRDLVGCWNYAYRPGCPWDGIICYPRVGDPERFEFGDLTRVRYVTSADSTDFKHFARIYMQADFADFNGDGLVDLVYCPSGGKELSLYLNSGKRDSGGMPVFVASGRIPRQTSAWKSCRAVDLDGDGSVDFVVGNTWLRNQNPKGWPIKPAKAVSLDAGRGACFLDVDHDGRLDAVCLEDKPGEGHSNHLVAWRRNLGGQLPKFAPALPLADIDVRIPRSLAAVTDDPRRGLLVTYNHYQDVSFFEQIDDSDGKPRFKRLGRAESLSAVLALSDQAWPCICDWDGDGDVDLLIGGGYGWPRILINEGSNQKMAFGEPQYILSEGKPIRILMSLVYPGVEEYKHNMGYPYPVLADWDGDGLADLMLPNCSNRVFWYKNVGTRRAPKFGPRLQLNPDGYEDTPEKRAQTGKILMSRWEGELEEGQPFYWRTGAAFADFNSDGLMDMVTHDGATRKAALFTQYRDARGKLRLKKAGPLKLSDGRLIDDRIVKRRSHWTESFRPADWDADGLIDLIYNCAGAHGGIQDGGSIYLLRNCGTGTEPKFEAPVTMRCFGKPIIVTNHGPCAWPGDFDGDGKLDLLTCVEWSVYPFFGHNALEMKTRPEFTISPVERIMTQER